jgi:hypothetical protein
MRKVLMVLLVMALALLVFSFATSKKAEAGDVGRAVFTEGSSEPVACRYGSLTTRSMDTVKKDIQDCWKPVKKYITVSIAPGSCTIFIDGNLNAIGEFQLCMTDKGYPTLGFDANPDQVGN